MILKTKFLLFFTVLHLELVPKTTKSIAILLLI